jgi:hypothetical protein
MPSGFPCPNPTCSHVFPPEAVKGAIALACPRCGSTFQFRSGAAASPAPPARPPKPVTPRAVTPPAPPVPLAAPVAPVVPLAWPVTPAEEPVAAFAPPPDFATPHLAKVRGRPRSRVGLYVFLGVAVVLLVPLCVTGWLARGWLARLHDLTPADQLSGPAYESTMYNFRFQYPPAPWKEDKQTRLDLRTGIALRRTEPNGWLAILTADYKNRTPTDADLVDDGVRRLKAYFKDGLEWEQKPDAQLAGQRAQRLEFVAQQGGVEMTGDAYLLGYNGVGYWFLTWAPTESRDVIAGEWDSIRTGFALGKEREGWAVKPAKQRTLAGRKAPYTLSYVESIWEKQDNPTAYDADADSALLGRDQAEPKDADKTSTAVVLLLPKQSDLKTAVAAARDHLLAQEKKLYPECTVEDVDAKAAVADRPPDRVGNQDGRILKLRVKIADANEHFVYLAVVPAAEYVVAVQCECDMRRRVYWEVNFAQLVRELKLKGH